MKSGAMFEVKDAIIDIAAAVSSAIRRYGNKVPEPKRALIIESQVFLGEFSDIDRRDTEVQRKLISEATEALETQNAVDRLIPEIFNNFETLSGLI